MALHAEADGVGVQRLSWFRVEHPPLAGLALGYGIAADRIGEGLRRLRRAFDRVNAGAVATRPRQLGAPTPIGPGSPARNRVRTGWEAGAMSSPGGSGTSPGGTSACPSTASAFYGLDGFLADPRATTLRRYEVEEMGDVAGRRLVHLQCHFGLDTLSWARRARW